MGWLKELGIAILGYWWALMSCAAFTILGLYALVLQKDSHWLIRSSFVFAGVFIVVAIALAWRDEHAARMKEVAKNTKPNFKMDILELVRNVKLDSDVGSTFFANVSLVNISEARSTLRAVYLRNPATETRAKAQLFSHGNLIRRKRVETPFPLDGEMTVPFTTVIVDLLSGISTVPLDKGTHREGWLKFPEVPFDGSKTGYRLYVQDAFGVEHGPFIPATELEAGFEEQKH
jgi:hypothetical protein